MAKTHVFDNPVETLLNYLTKLLDGENNINFIWYSEPDHHQCKFEKNKTQQHKLQASLTNCLNLYSIEALKLETIVFTVKTKVFMTSVLKQMEKIMDLMAEKSYREGREQFPYKAFSGFKSAFDKLYGKKQ